MQRTYLHQTSIRALWDCSRAGRCGCLCGTRKLSVPEPASFSKCRRCLHTAASVIVELPARADNLKELHNLLRRVTATNHIVGLMSPVMNGSYRHLSAKKLCLVKRDSFFHHMESSIGYLMSQDAVSDQRSNLALPPVGMFIPELSELRIMSDP